MHDKYDIKIHAVQCKLALAKYWGTCEETLLHAVSIIRETPEVSVEDALKQGFDRSVMELTPMNA